MTEIFDSTEEYFVAFENLHPSMDEPQPNQRFQFTLRALLLYTFGAAVWLAFFRCNSLASVLTAWLLMFLYYLYARNGWCLLIHSSGLFGSCIALASGMSFQEPLFYVGLKISGIATFLAYNYFMLIDLFPASSLANQNRSILKCPRCHARISAEKPESQPKETCPNCGEKLYVEPRLSAAYKQFLIILSGSIICALLLFLFVYFILSSPQVILPTAPIR